jgi:hypothetical protein
MGELLVYPRASRVYISRYIAHEGIQYWNCMDLNFDENALGMYNLRRSRHRENRDIAKMFAGTEPHGDHVEG